MGIYARENWLVIAPTTWEEIEITRKISQNGFSTDSECVCIERAEADHESEGRSEGPFPFGFISSLFLSRAALLRPLGKHNVYAEVFI